MYAVSEWNERPLMYWSPVQGVAPAFGLSVLAIGIIITSKKVR